MKKSLKLQFSAEFSNKEIPMNLSCLWKDKLKLQLDGDGFTEQEFVVF